MGLFGPSRSHSSSHYRRSTTSSGGYFVRPSSSSYYSSSSRRRPRDGFISRILHQLRRMFRDLIGFARRNPVRFFMMVIMPLLTGGALTGLLRTFGIRLPPGMLGAAGRSYGGGYNGRSSGGLGSLASGGGVQGLMKIAQAFV